MKPLLALCTVIIVLCQCYQTYLAHQARYEVISYTCSTDADCERACVAAGFPADRCAVDVDPE